MYWYFKSQGEPPGVMNLSDIATVEVSDNEVCFKMSPKFCSLFYWMRGFSLVGNVTSLVCWPSSGVLLLLCQTLLHLGSTVEQKKHDSVSDILSGLKQIQELLKLL